MSGDHFGAYGDPPSLDEIRTRQSIQRINDEERRVKALEHGYNIMLKYLKAKRRETTYVDEHKELDELIKKVEGK